MASDKMDIDTERRGFISLPRELRDQIYEYWSNDEAYRYHDDDGTWIPFEDPEKPAQCTQITTWRINNTLSRDYSQALLLNHQIASEFLSSVFSDLHLLLSIEHLAINESFAPWTLQSWNIPALFLDNAREMDIRVSLIPRYSFAQRHTIEAQLKLLRDRGYNNYMGEFSNAVHRSAMSVRKAQTIGKKHIEWRSPESAFARFEEMMAPVSAAVAERGMSMPERVKDEYDSDRHLQRYVFWELMSAGKHSAMRNRFDQRIEAIKKVWHVELPWGDWMGWFKDDVYGRDAELAEMLERVLWEDFIVGMRMLAEQLLALSEAAKNLTTLRVHLRVQDGAVAGVRCALWELLEEIPTFMELKSLESVSLFSKGDLFNGGYATNIEQWTSNVDNSADLRAAIARSGVAEQVNIRIKGGRLVRNLDLMINYSKS